MNAKELLIAAKALISDPESWTKGAYARDSDGRTVPCNSPGAVCFCSLGALEHALGDPPDLRWGAAEIITYETALATLERVAKDAIPSFNDSHSREEVMEMWGQGDPSHLT